LRSSISRPKRCGDVARRGSRSGKRTVVEDYAHYRRNEAAAVLSGVHDAIVKFREVLRNLHMTMGRLSLMPQVIAEFCTKLNNAKFASGESYHISSLKAVQPSLPRRNLKLTEHPLQSLLYRVFSNPKFIPTALVRPKAILQFATHEALLVLNGWCCLCELHFALIARLQPKPISANRWHSNQLDFGYQRH